MVAPGVAFSFRTGVAFVVVLEIGVYRIRTLSHFALSACVP